MHPGGTHRFPSTLALVALLDTSDKGETQSRCSLGPVHPQLGTPAAPGGIESAAAVAASAAVSSAVHWMLDIPSP